MASAYDFTFETLKGTPYPLSQHAGKAILVVNTASQCGFTPQYKALQALVGQFPELVMIGVPSNDFGGQEPGSSAEIGQFCEINYGVTFPIMAKVHAVGPNADPFFRWVAQAGGFWAKPRWNFYKYLIGKDGKLVRSFSSLTAPGAPKFISAIGDVLR